MTRWLWDSFGAGSKAVIFWLWHPRVGGTEAGEWGLVSLDGKPSIRLPAVKSVIDGLKRNAYLAEAKPQPAKVAILYNRESAIINSLDERTQHRGDEVEDSLMGCYLALHRAHIPIQFVDIEQLKKTIPDNISVLYAPYSYAIDDQGVAALRDFVSRGGTLWADGLTAWKTEMGEIRPTIPGGLSDVFGVEASDIYPVKADEPYSVTSQNERAGELWKLPLELKGAEVVMRDREGKPFATRHRLGKGQALYFESALTLAYFKRSNPFVQRLIVKPALEAQANALVQLTQGSDKVCFRGLAHPSGPIAILSNWGDAESVTVSFRGSYAVSEALNGKPVQVTREQGRTLATVRLPAGAVALLRAKKYRARSGPDSRNPTLAPLGERVARDGDFISRLGPGEGVAPFPHPRATTRAAPTDTSAPRAGTARRGRRPRRSHPASSPQTPSLARVTHADTDIDGARQQGVSLRQHALPVPLLRPRVQRAMEGAAGFDGRALLQDLLHVRVDVPARIRHHARAELLRQLRAISSEGRNTVSSVAHSPSGSVISRNSNPGRSPIACLKRCLFACRRSRMVPSFFNWASSTAAANSVMRKSSPTKGRRPISTPVRKR